MACSSFSRSVLVMSSSFTLATISSSTSARAGRMPARRRQQQAAIRAAARAVMGTSGRILGPRMIDRASGAGYPASST
jgi:hypothetical protein